MVARRGSSGLHAYVFAVSAVGLGLLVLLARSSGLATVQELPPVFWALVICLVVNESFPVLLPRAGSRLATTAETFAFAILLGWGTAPAAFALVLGAVVADGLRRRAPEKLLFNAGQYGLLMAVAGGVYEALGDGRPFTAGRLPAFAVAALVFFVGNLVLVGVVTSLAYGRDFVTDLKESLRVEARPYAMVFGMAPIMLVVAQNEVSLLPLLLLPLLAVWVALKTAIEADQGRAAAEEAAEQARQVAAEQARLAAAEHALVERLQESDRLKDELLASVSHELRTPLAGLLGALATLSAREGQLTEAQRQELVGMAARQGDRLRAQIEQLLLAARLEQSTQEPEERPLVDAAAVAREALAAAREAYPGRAFVFEGDQRLPVQADARALSQVLGNLLDNAAKYSPDTSPIRLEASRYGALAVLAVEDAGPGVPAPERDRIFERFTQLDTGATRRAGGVGLGLYIARQLANAQGGELLAAEPAHATGARFELRLPLAEEPRPNTLANVASAR
jgi:signal transduction histidine kinase